MSLTNVKSPLVKLPPSVELTLFLIQEELKTRKFFNGLRQLGLSDSHYQPNLDVLIMTNVGLDDTSNETFDFYYELIEKYSRKIEPDRDSIMEHAFNAYVDLIIEQRRRSESK